MIQSGKAYLHLESQTDRFMQIDPTEDIIKKALLRMDAEVLQLYDLPPRLERQLLDLFEGVKRKGGGCDRRGYYPEGLDAYAPIVRLAVSPQATLFPLTVGYPSLRE